MSLSFQCDFELDGLYVGCDVDGKDVTFIRSQDKVTVVKGGRLQPWSMLLFYAGPWSWVMDVFGSIVVCARGCCGRKNGGR
jgi:hypothetical protein